jgi:hypothetical protein
MAGWAFGGEAIMESRIKSAIAALRHPRPARLASGAIVVLIAMALGASTLRAQQQPAQPQIPDMSLAQGSQGGNFLLTIFLKHDQSKNLDQINAQLKAQGFYKAFPPEGTQVVSWYVMMGVGQVVTLRVPAERLRDVNRAIEQTAWGGYRTEFYPTYDYKSIGEDNHAKALAQ